MLEPGQQVAVQGPFMHAFVRGQIGCPHELAGMSGCVIGVDGDKVRVRFSEEDIGRTRFKDAELLLPERVLTLAPSLG